MSDRVLMIEDDDHLAEMVVEYLGGMGIEVRSQSTARDGLAALRSEQFDALILDIMLPDLDGLEVYDQPPTGRHRREP